MSKITQAARGETCTVRLGGICSHDPSTTVFAHLNGAGWALKMVKNGVDLGCFACADCHAWLDGGYVKTNTRDERDLEHWRATIETFGRLLDKGIIILA